MASREISQCVPQLQAKYYRMKDIAESKGVHFALTCTSRLAIEQRALFAQGREKLEMVNHLREDAGLYAITEEANKRPVTWTLDSKHIINDKRRLSEAFDVVILGKDDKASWDLKVDANDDDIPDWLELAEIGRSVGLKCGADFMGKDGKPKPDYPHFEV